LSALVLRTLVIVLGMLILAAFAAVIWGIVVASNDDGNGAITETLEERSLGLPSAACRIVRATTEGGLLTVVSDGPAGDPECNRVFVVDLASGRIRAEIRP
jgi:hypothetical protein